MAKSMPSLKPQCALSLGGVRDEARIAGPAATYIRRLPGPITR